MYLSRIGQISFACFLSLIFKFEKLHEWHADFCSKSHEYSVPFVLRSDGIEYNSFLHNNYVYTDG